MFSKLIAEFLGTALMIVFGVGVHCDEVLNKTKYQGSGHLFAITTWGFGITIALIIFGDVCINPAMALAQAILGLIPWAYFVPYVIAEMAGGVFGALIVYVMYKDHFDASGDIDPIRVRNIFSTNPNIRNLPRNFFVEAFATFVFLSSIFAIVKNAAVYIPIAVGLLVWAIGMGLGGPTGFAMNPARDLGPRLAYSLVPIKNRTNNDWQYGLLIPGIAPYVGAACAALFAKFYLGM
ncbi:D/L-lactic acid transporter LarD [Mageeibacillus indolicus]|uniref:MIP family channel protein n=2 Tax=Mageeibacillus indolicus TaxID=884684 RepID=D3R2Q5_MAGIU|nr:D/L-lactic acid transporter LarD [Mageeibacillus indolicus]ADC91553.1 MIP family channel protein [Mageeibacillus indolicus UPII9-5]KFA57351.1 glycerol transporter [Mageeibacillus indolicus 0009-5]PNH19940.1 glycerol transporter [Mageeibacillus indolicus]